MRFDLSGFTGCLDVLEMNLWILARVDDGSQEVKESFKALHVQQQIIPIILFI